MLPLTCLLATAVINIYYILLHYIFVSIKSHYISSKLWILNIFICKAIWRTFYMEALNIWTVRLHWTFVSLPICLVEYCAQAFSRLSSLVSTIIRKSVSIIVNLYICLLACLSLSQSACMTNCAGLTDYTVHELNQLCAARLRHIVSLFVCLFVRMLVCMT